MLLSILYTANIYFANIMAEIKPNNKYGVNFSNKPDLGKCIIACSDGLSWVQGSRSHLENRFMCEKRRQIFSEGNVHFTISSLVAGNTSGLDGFIPFLFF